MKSKETWWCMKSGNILLPFSARSTKKQCIEHATKDHDCTYEMLKKSGYKCVPIIISERLTPNTDENGK